MKVKTNKVSCKLAYEEIANDFSFMKVHFEKRKEALRAYSMSFPEYKILCSYQQSRNNGNIIDIYLMGRKGEANFSSYIQDAKEKGLTTLTAEELTVEDFSGDKDYILISLLLRLLACGRDTGEEIPYGNYYGHLLAERKPYTKKESKNGITVNDKTVMFNRLDFTKDNTITVSVETWKPFVTNINKSKGKLRSQKSVLEIGPLNQYMIKVPWEKVNEAFTQWLAATSEEKEKLERNLFSRWYVRGTYLPMKKNWMPFVTLDPKTGFQDKARIYFKFLRDVKDKLGAYLQFTPVEEVMTRYKVKKGKEALKEQGRLLQEALEGINQHKLTLVGQYAKQREYAEEIIHSLYGIAKGITNLNDEAIHISDKPNPDTWNLQVVYAKDSVYYQDACGKYCRDKDDYYVSSSICLQHYGYTEGEEDKDRETKLKVILLELLLKDGLIQNHLSSYLCPNKDMTVAKSMPLYNDDGTFLCTEFFAMTISASGDITDKSHFIDLETPPGDIEEELLDVFDTNSLKYEGRKTLMVPEGYFKIGDGRFCTIFRTTERPFPDYEKMEQDYLQYLSSRNRVDKEIIFFYLCQYAKDKPKYQEALELVSDLLASSPESSSFTVKEWKKILSEACKKAGTKLRFFSEYLANETNGKVKLVLNIKRETNNPYDLDQLTQIAYTDTGDMYQYFVGKRSLGVIGKKPTLRSAFPIRMVEKDTSYTFDEYAAMLDVSWVRAGTRESTVIPYPFKILNEYIKTEKEQGVSWGIPKTKISK